MTYDRPHTHCCEHCGRASADLKYVEAVDEYWCDSCIDNTTFEEDEDGDCE